MRYTLVSFLLISLLGCKSLFSPGQEKNWISLFNGKDLQGWDTYIGFDRDSIGNKLSDTPVGLNHDPLKVFSVIEKNGEKMIRISGENFGAISTKAEYSNFHLQLKFKWGMLKWGQMKKRKKDSGLLYYSTGSFGADYGAWMRSQEFQIEEGNVGDYWGVAGAIADAPVVKNKQGVLAYNFEGKMMTFSENSEVGRHCIKQGDAERPVGEWNTLDLYCSGDTSIHMVNGKIMMILFHSRQLEKGKQIPLTKGKIQLQSEGSEIFFKDIRTTSIVALPPQFLK